MITANNLTMKSSLFILTIKRFILIIKNMITVNSQKYESKEIFIQNMLLVSTVQKDIY